MHHDGNVGELLDRREDKVTQEGRAGVLAGTGGGLHDHGAVRVVGGLHDGAHLFHVVDIVGRHAVAVLGSVVQQLAQGYEGHFEISLLS